MSHSYQDQGYNQDQPYQGEYSQYPAQSWDNGELVQIQTVETLLRDMDNTASSISQSVTQAADSVTNTVHAVGDIVHCVSDTVKHVQMVERQFQLVIAQMNNNLELFKVKLPTIERNLDRIQQRLDQMNQTIMRLYRPDMSESDLHYVNACLKAMEHSNNSLNNMLSMLM